jgi:hypothetical protein
MTTRGGGIKRAERCAVSYFTSEMVGFGLIRVDFSRFDQSSGIRGKRRKREETAFETAFAEAGL